MLQFEKFEQGRCSCNETNKPQGCGRNRPWEVLAHCYHELPILLWGDAARAIRRGCQCYQEVQADCGRSRVFLGPECCDLVAGGVGAIVQIVGSLRANERCHSCKWSAHRP